MTLSEARARRALREMTLSEVRARRALSYLSLLRDIVREMEKDGEVDPTVISEPLEEMEQAFCFLAEYE